MAGDPVAEVVPLLQALIRNRCVNDGSPGSGHEIRSVGTLADYLGRGGEVIEPLPGRASVVYRVRGTEPGAPRLLLMGHTDVVPANESGWTRDPFGAEIVDGFLWGRGAIDMLNLTAAMAVVFKRVLVGDLPPPPGDLLFLAVADEEAAGGLGARHLVEDRWDLVAAENVLTEIAYPPIDTGRGVGYPVSVGEKGPFWTVMRSTGEPAHGSTPYGVRNAIEPMTAALQGLFHAPSPVVIGEEWRAFVDALDPPEELKSRLLDPERVDGAIEDLRVDQPGFAAYVHACTHLTVSPNVVSGGVKANVVADAAIAQVDLRALPGQDRNDVNEHLRKAMGEAGGQISLEPVADHPANASPRRTRLWQVVVAALEDLTGSDRAVPTLMPATTDARFFRARGATAYGVGLFDRSVSFADFLGMFHGNDERVSVRSAELTTRLLGRILERWSGRE